MKRFASRVLLVALSLALALTVIARAQSNPLSTDNAKKEGEVVWTALSDWRNDCRSDHQSFRR
jgi:hypothetical protein